MNQSHRTHRYTRRRRGLSFLSEDMNNTLIATVDAAAEEQNARCEPDVYSPDGELLNPAPAIEYDVDDMQQQGSE